MIPGRDKPHIKKVRGYWCVFTINHLTLWKIRAAYTFVEERNALIRINKEKSHEQAKQPDQTT